MVYHGSNYHGGADDLPAYVDKMLTKLKWVWFEKQSGLTCVEGTLHRADEVCLR